MIRCLTHDLTFSTAADASDHIGKCAMQPAPLTDLEKELVGALKFALNESGCDGDLCAHEWHEKARAVLAKVGGDRE